MREVIVDSTGVNGQTGPNTPSELNYGSGSPEGVYLGFASPIPSLYVDTSTPALYVKQSGNGTRTGWGQVAGGGGGGGDITHVAVPVAFDAPGLSSPSGDIPGAVIWTPAIGDILIDGWIEVVTAFAPNDITARPNLYLASTAGALTNNGLWDWGGNAFLLDAADQALFQGDNAKHVICGNHGGFTAASGGYQVAVDLNDFTNFQRFCPAKWVAADPLVLIVSDDGSSGGNDPECDAGELIVHLLVIPA